MDQTCIWPSVTSSGSGSNSNNNNDIGGLVTEVKRLVAVLQGKGRGVNKALFEANLLVDGQKMAAESQKHIGAKSYGDR